MHRTKAGVKRRLRSLLPAALLLLSPAGSAGQAFEDKLTGDWSGLRTQLADQGVDLNLDFTQYYQGLLSGTGSKSFEYGGRFDAQVDFDLGKLGLLDGAALHTLTEYRYGALDPFLGGVLVATNAGLVLPANAHRELVVSSLYIAQKLGETVNLMVGKINTDEFEDTNPFFGGYGRDRFLNAAFAASPSGVMPSVIMGAVISVDWRPVAWTFMVFDPDDRTRDYAPTGFVHDGVTFSVSGSSSAVIADHTGSLTVSATYSTKEDVELEDLLLPPELRTGRRERSWYTSVELAYFLHENPERPMERWGLFLTLGATDGDPNPYQATLFLGVGGQGLLGSRPNDRFGLGYFFIKFSDTLQSTLTPFVSLKNEDGVEAYYDYAVVGWLRVAADLQYVKPALGDARAALVAGWRVGVSF